MALKVELKPNEKIILGNSVITNGPNRARFYIKGNAVILREKDILTADSADTPCKRIYFAIQMFYLSEEETHNHTDYFAQVNEVIAAAPTTLIFIEEINKQMLTNNYYKALKEARKLIDYEKELFDNA
ncbi:MAG: flagellar biosynthesis repressor FlbT [Alphaproteobacteria bacterium]|nr:flagellar biosynthesis repressor FlbT [Alphaproteobacteria bacterium]